VNKTPEDARLAAWTWGAIVAVYAAAAIGLVILIR
jgi:hypothetical protein